jgi:serine/threonine-protein kinase
MNSCCVTPWSRPPAPTALVERFRREASTAANLDHPDIVAVYGQEESNGIHDIAMEYVRERSLQSLIRQGTLLESRR